MPTDREVEALIYRSCLLLDDENYAGYLELCAQQFSYKITAYSHELRKPMVWLHHDRQGLANLFEMLPKHVRMPGELTRQASVYWIERDEKNSEAYVTTSLIVTYTSLEGVSQLFAIGKYHDLVDMTGNVPLLRAREVKLKTRDLNPGSHIPI
jgi:methanesulfonate monooxygenase small subunit